MKKLIEIIKGIKILSSHGNTNKSINGITDNSKNVKNNFLFFAIEGNDFDGHNFIEDAISNGSNTIVCTKLPSNLEENISYLLVEDIRESVYNISSNFYGNPDKKIKIIAVTGTNGKTSIVYFLYQFFKSLDIKVGMLSTIENRIGNEVLNAKLTTPNPVEFLRILNDMVLGNCQYCFMEASSHAIHQKRILGKNIFAAIFSNLSHDHLDYHKTFKNYIDAKKILFDDLGKNSYSIMNSDDKRANYVIQNTKSKVVTYGIKNISDFNAKVIESTGEGLILNFGTIDVAFKIIGDFNAYNILAVYSLANILNIDKNLILEKLSELNTPSGRFDFLLGEKERIGIVDYAHTPDALENVLLNILKFKNNKKLITIVGAGGDRDKSKRPEMGKIVTKYSDFVFFTSDNPRDENENNIISDIINGVSKDNYEVEIDRKKAIEMAFKRFNNNSIILVAGKGHEKYQVIGDKSLPHDDKEIIKKLIL